MLHKTVDNFNVLIVLFGLFPSSYHFPTTSSISKHSLPFFTMKWDLRFWKLPRRFWLTRHGSGTSTRWDENYFWGCWDRCCSPVSLSDVFSVVDSRKYQLFGRSSQWQTQSWQQQSVVNSPSTSSNSLRISTWIQKRLSETQQTSYKKAQFQNGFETFSFQFRGLKTLRRRNPGTI